MSIQIRLLGARLATLGLALAAGCGGGAAPEIEAPTTVPAQAAPVKVSPQQALADQRSALAGASLEAIAAARAAVEAGDSDAAGAKIDVALAEITKIAAAEPAIDVSMAVLDAGQHGADAPLPLTAERLAGWSALGGDPEVAIDQARSEAALSALSAPEGATWSGLAMFDATLCHRALDLALASTALRLRAARQSLDAGRLADAGEALASAPLGPEIIAMVQRPFNLAHAQLDSARQALLIGDRALAEHDLESARSILFEASVDMDTEPLEREAAGALASDIAEIGARLKAGDPLTEPDLRGTSLRIGAWMERAVARVALSMEDGGLDIELADALAHLTEAETAQFTDDDSGRVLNNREAAFADIDHALKRADPTTKPAVEAARAASHDLSRTLISDEADGAVLLYAQLTAGLRAAIWGL